MTTTKKNFFFLSIALFVLLSITIGASAEEMPVIQAEHFSGELKLSLDETASKVDLTLFSDASTLQAKNYVMTISSLEKQAGQLPLTLRGEWEALRGTVSNPDALVYQLNPDYPDTSFFFISNAKGHLTLLTPSQEEIPSDMGGTLKKDPSVLINKEAEELLKLPATYQGLLPAADGPGIVYTLTVRPDRLYQLDITYIEAEKGKDETFASLGWWSLSKDGGIITLHESDAETILFAIDSPQKITMLDYEGRRSVTSLNYTLSRKTRVEEHLSPIPMKGMFSYMADAAFFTDCFTGKIFPVAMEKGYLSLEQTYTALPHEAGKPVYAVVEAHLAMRPAMEGNEIEEMLVIDRFIEVQPNRTCDEESSSHLEERVWKLTLLRGETISTLSPSDNQPMTLRFDVQAHRVTGYAGCNNFFGPYSRTGKELYMGPIAATRRYCESAMETEKLYLESLELVSGFKIVDNRLELYHDGALLAVFEPYNP